MDVKYERKALATPHGLMSALQALFPEFGDDEFVANVQTGEANLHTVMMEFRSSFSAAASTDRQLRSFAGLVAECVEVDDVLENAVGTCFLEALGRGDPFWKFLSPDVKAYVRSH